MLASCSAWPIGGRYTDVTGRLGILAPNTVGAHSRAASLRSLRSLSGLRPGPRYADAGLRGTIASEVGSPLMRFQAVFGRPSRTSDASTWLASDGGRHRTERSK